MIYRFVGAHCEIGGRAKLVGLGQEIDLPESLAQDVVAGGGAIIPDDVFLSIGFSESDLERYRDTGARVRRGMDPEFEAKFNAAQDHFRAWTNHGIRPVAPNARPAPADGGNEKREE